MSHPYFTSGDLADRYRLERELGRRDGVCVTPRRAAPAEVVSGALDGRAPTLLVRFDDPKLTVSS